MKLVFNETLDNLYRRARDAENDSEQWRRMYENANRDLTIYRSRYNSLRWSSEGAQDAREAAKSAREALEKSEARATQLEAQNAALRGALLALGGAVIEVTQ